MGVRLYFSDRDATRNRFDALGAWLLAALFWLAVGAVALIVAFFVLLVLMHMIF